MNVQEFEYYDIINYSRPVSKTRPRMSNLDRAAQFAPFAALTGFDEEINETARQTDSKHELTEDELDMLNAALCELMERETEKPRVSILYFQPDKSKAGGAYLSYTGNLRFFDESSMELKFVDDNRIRISDIMKIEIPKESAQNI